MQTITCKTAFGQNITSYLNDGLVEAIQKEGFYEKHYIEFTLAIFEIIKPNIVFDIGANIGNHSLAYCTKAKNVYSFEPALDTFNLLKTNITQNKISNVHIFNKGLGDKNEILTLYRDYEEHTNTSSFIKNWLDVKTELKMQAEIVTGDTFVESEKLEQLDFMKIDAEGFEEKILHGFKNSIKKFRPIILMEFLSSIQNKKFDFQEENYSVFSLMRNDNIFNFQPRILHKLRRKIFKKTHELKIELRDLEIAYNCLITDIILIPNEKLFLVPKKFRERINI